MSDQNENVGGPVTFIFLLNVKCNDSMEPALPLLRAVSRAVLPTGGPAA